MVFARGWARSRPLAGYQGCRRGAGDYGGPTAGQTEPYGPRVHRGRPTFAAPLTHGQSLSAAKSARLTWSTVDDHRSGFSCYGSAKYRLAQPALVGAAH